MGFLSARTETVDLHNGYYAKVRELTTDEYAPLEELLAQIRVDPNAGSMGASVHVADYRRALMAAALVDWNLDDEQNDPLPVSLDSVRRLPVGAFETIYQAVIELNGTRRGRDAAQFPDSGDGGDQVGVGGSGDSAAVPDGAGAVEAVGAASGGLA